MCLVISTILITLMAGQFGSSGNITDIYLRDSRFESRPGTRTILSVFHAFPHFLQANFEKVPPNRPRSPGSVCFSIHHSFISLPSYTLNPIQWSRDLRHELSSLARTLGSWVGIPLEAWMSVCVYFVFVLGNGLATGWSLVQGVPSNVLD
jgi:hypothetical protein